MKKKKNFKEINALDFVVLFTNFRPMHCIFMRKPPKILWILSVLVRSTDPLNKNIDRVIF